ncbi:MAG: glycosyltransferase [Candidatus Omnitrophica bacterium]|nr:glycosyltransferase [Candidatus Omnitrophota bacterium]
MKILIVGEFLPFRIEIFYRYYFNLLGCKVFTFHTGIIPKILELPWQFIINRQLLKKIRLIKPELILVIKGYFLYPDTILKIKELIKMPIFCFNPDDPFNIFYPGSSNENIIRAIPYYDCYFTFNRNLLEKIKKGGVRRVEYLPFAFDPQLHHPIEVTEEEKGYYGNDVVFIGNWSIEREGYLKELKRFDLAIWGENYWKRLCKDKDLKKRWRKKAVYGTEQSKVLNSSKISLNILRAQNKGSHNMRTFELPACGAFVVSERSPEIEEFFKEDEEIVLFSSPDELKEKIGYYLHNEEKRKRIAEAGFRRCIESNYTYQRRAERILEIADNV